MPRNLLVADDSITIQKVIGITFAGEDFRVVAVDNGADALLKAREIRPDIILADVVMPRKNGYEVCESIKADPELRHIPVLLLAGTFEAFDDSRARAALADGHIAKPFETQALITKVNELLAHSSRGSVRESIAGSVGTAMHDTGRTPPETAASNIAPAIASSPVGTVATGAAPRRVPSAPETPPQPVASHPSDSTPNFPAAPVAGPSPKAAAVSEDPAPALPSGRKQLVTEPVPAELVPDDRSAAELVPGDRPTGRPPPVPEIAWPSGERHPSPPEASPGVPVDEPEFEPRKGTVEGLGYGEPVDLAHLQTFESTGSSQASGSADRTSQPDSFVGTANTDGGERELRDALSRASREVIERIAWEIMPALAETIIREHIERLAKNRKA